MYLGLLVVGGAAPQTFAHSATTRNFELVDEIEVKDDLDNKPSELSNEAADAASSDTSHKITRSVQKFLSEFKTIDSAASYCSFPDLGFEQKHLPDKTETSSDHDRFGTHIPLDQILTVTNLPRAGLETLLATDAK